MKYKKLILSIFVVLLSFTVFIFSLAVFINYYSNSGSMTLNKEYYSIIFNDISIDFDTSMSIKTDNDNNILYFNIPNLNEFKSERIISVNLVNIGNIDVYLDDYIIESTYKNIDTNNISITLSTDDITINGGETKKINIKIKYNGHDNVNIPFDEFYIKYKFNKVIL